jgi:hypothetical protein
MAICGSRGSGLSRSSSALNHLPSATRTSRGKAAARTSMTTPRSANPNPATSPRTAAMTSALMPEARSTRRAACSMDSWCGLAMRGPLARRVFSRRSSALASVQELSGFTGWLYSVDCRASIGHCRLRCEHDERTSGRCATFASRPHLEVDGFLALQREFGVSSGESPGTLSPIESLDLIADEIDSVSWRPASGSKQREGREILAILSRHSHVERCRSLDRPSNYVAPPGVLCGDTRGSNGA